MMSTENEAVAEVDEVCASCGKAEVDDVKLMTCACKLVKYCRDECQINHREQHEEECKKRSAELRDRDLFEQPQKSHVGDCPICCLPLPMGPSKAAFSGCCSKMLCMGCNFANQMREIEEGLEKRCAFCREPLAKWYSSDEELQKLCMKRVKKNCPAALCYMGRIRNEEGDFGKAFEYWTKAAELGDADAHHNLSCMYREGEGVEEDIEKAIYHLEEAAIGGHPQARHNLGYIEVKNGRFERARKHWIIAANLGFHNSLTGLKNLYAVGHASKEDYADALRAYQTAVNETKNAEREEGEHFFQLSQSQQGLYILRRQFTATRRRYN